MKVSLKQYFASHDCLLTETHENIKVVYFSVSIDFPTNRICDVDKGRGPTINGK